MYVSVYVTSRYHSTFWLHRSLHAKIVGGFFPPLNFARPWQRNMAAGLCTGFERARLFFTKNSLFKVFCLSKTRHLSRRNRQFSSSRDEARPEDCKVLYLNSSGSDKRSFTGQTANEFLSRYRELHPSHSIEEINLWDANLLRFSLSHVESKMRIAGGEELPEDSSKFLAVQEMARHLLGASKLIVSCPMWNFSVPYVLKQYIDCVVQSDLTFRETESGVEGLVIGRPLLLITSSSYDYSVEPLSKLDFQVPYLKTIFNFIGFRDVRHIYIADTKNNGAETLMKHARQRIEEEVVRF